MATSYVGEIRMFGGNFAPTGWMFCDGSVLAISQFETLFNLIGTTYGGDGQSTFALPDLRSRVPVHQGTDPNGNSYTIGQLGGAETVTLTLAETPTHAHMAQAISNAATLVSPANNVWAAWADNPYSTSTPTNALADQALSNFAGGGGPHENLLPFLCVNFIISMFGVFPSQT